MTGGRSALDAPAILKRLVAAGVDFVVIGGIAAVLHGSARATFDLDVCYATNASNLDALGQALVGLRARLKGISEEIPFVPDARTLSRVDLLTMDTDAGELDVLARPAGGPSYYRLRQRAESFQLDDVSVRVASLEDLIAMKRAAGRAKDLASVEELEAILRLRDESG
jgi:hypothetical protein